MPITFSYTAASSTTGVQGSYPQAIDFGHEGLLADATIKDSITGINNTGSPLPFGVLVVADGAGAADNAVKTVTTGVSKALGITIDSFAFETTLDANDRPSYPDDEPVNVLVRGAIVVYTEEAVNVGDPVRVRTVASGSNYAGRFRKTSVTGQTAVLGNAWFESKTTTSGLAVVRISSPELTLTAD